MSAKFLKLVFLAALAVVSGLFYFKLKVSEIALQPAVSEFLPKQLPPTQSLLLETENQVISPPPLRVVKESQPLMLTSSGIIKLTNNYRVAQGLTPLQENSLLNSAAKAKVEDMFHYQYFAHESPTGWDAGDFVRAAGYDYLLVGENLAEGRFKDDQDLVEAWLESPGHRANIMNAKFTEIGVYVKQGFLNGRLTWLAVQEFALPSSFCPQPSAALKSEIEANRNQLIEWAQVLKTKKAELDSLGSVDWREYNRRVEEYNSWVAQYNDLLSKTRELIEVYNSQATAFNNCLK